MGTRRVEVLFYSFPLILRTSFILSWEVKSISPLQEYRLLYRPLLQVVHKGQAYLQSIGTGSTQRTGLSTVH